MKKLVMVILILIILMSNLIGCSRNVNDAKIEKFDVIEPRN